MPGDRPKHVLQVFQNTARYGPDLHNAADRRDLTRWNDPVSSTSGYLEDGVVRLPEAVLLDRGFATHGVVVLWDHNSDRSRQPGHETGEMGPLLNLQPPERAKLTPLHIFAIGPGQDGMELHLRYSDHEMWIGKPSRADYKLADLRPHRPVLVRINGKSDHTMSAGRERQYLAAEFLFEYLGEHSSFEVMERPSVSKSPPVEKARLVDLNRILY